MQRSARASVGEVFYHVLNRGNARREVFHREEDYQAFVKLMEEGVRTPADAGSGLVYHAKPLPSGAVALW